MVGRHVEILHSTFGLYIVIVTSMPYSVLFLRVHQRFYLLITNGIHGMN